MFNGVIDSADYIVMQKIAQGEIQATALELGHGDGCPSAYRMMSFRFIRISCSLRLDPMLPNNVVMRIYLCKW